MGDVVVAEEALVDGRVLGVEGAVGLRRAQTEAVGLVNDQDVVALLGVSDVPHGQHHGRVQPRRPAEDTLEGLAEGLLRHDDPDAQTTAFGAAQQGVPVGVGEQVEEVVVGAEIHLDVLLREVGEVHEQFRQEHAHHRLAGAGAALNDERAAIDVVIGDEQLDDVPQRCLLLRREHLEGRELEQGAVEDLLAGAAEHLLRPQPLEDVREHLLVARAVVVVRLRHAGVAVQDLAGAVAAEHLDEVALQVQGGGLVELVMEHHAHRRQAGLARVHVVLSSSGDDVRRLADVDLLLIVDHVHSGPVPHARVLLLLGGKGAPERQALQRVPGVVVGHDDVASSSPPVGTGCLIRVFTSLAWMISSTSQPMWSANMNA